MKKLIEVHCDYCFKTFKRHLSKFKYRHKYCSLSCSYEHKRVQTIKNNAKRILNLDKDFLNWFAGFWEGEGSLVTCCISRERKTPRFTLYQSDEYVINYIKNKFKLGRISIQPANGLSKRQGYVYQTSKFGECVLFAYILRKRLKSKYKQKQLNDWIKKFKIKKYFKYIKE